MSVETAPAPQPRRAARGVALKAWRRTRLFRPVLVLDIVLLLFFGLTQPSFATGLNIENMLAGVSTIWIVAMGMTFVLVSGGFDLSVGAISTVAGVLMAKVIGLGVPGGLAVLIAILAGALIGALLNGTLVGYLRLSVFVVTLATLTGLTGVVNLWTNTHSYIVTAPIVEELALEHVAGLPTPVWIMLGTFLLGLYLQRRTYFGRDVYAVGGSLTAARLSGVKASLTLIAVYGISGACAALSGVIAVGRIGAATPEVDSNLALQAIAAVLLGGTPLTGGDGGVGGTVLGVLFIGILQNGLDIAGVPSFWQQVVTAVILVTAVLAGRDRTGAKRWRRRFLRSGAGPNVDLGR